MALDPNTTAIIITAIICMTIIYCLHRILKHNKEMGDGTRS